LKKVLVFRRASKILCILFLYRHGKTVIRPENDGLRADQGQNGREPANR